MEGCRVPAGILPASGISVMSLFLLVLGAVTAVAGLVLVASGVILPEGTFGTEVVTPGTIAAVGGLLLVGIAIAVRQLQRIEQALAARPPHPRSRPKRLSSSARSRRARRCVFRFRQRRSRLTPVRHRCLRPQPQRRRRPKLPHLKLRPAKFPVVAPLESAPVVEEADVALMPQTPAHFQEAIHEVKNGAVIGRGANGATPFRPVPRVVAKTRQSCRARQGNGCGIQCILAGEVTRRCPIGVR